MADTEWWQRGPVDGVAALLQPVAHILLQVRESVGELVENLTEAQWNARPGGVASSAFHVRHITGVIDRLFTYARGQPLSAEQFAAIKQEGTAVTSIDVPVILSALSRRVDAAVDELKTIDVATLGDFRAVGRARLPSTVIGCLVHGAEHSMRHVGQLSVTTRVVRAGSIPEILTPRLRLRSLEPRDVDAYATIMADPEVTRHLGDGKPLSHADAWRQIAMFLGHWSLRGFGLWAVELRATGEFAGRIGLYEPDGWPGFELGYTLGRQFWGHGYAREGAGAALDYARRVLGRTEIISLIRPGNIASIRVAESLGATLRNEIDFFGASTLVYEYPRVQARPG